MPEGSAQTAPLPQGGITQEEYDKKLVAMKDKQQILSIELEQYTDADHNYKTTVASVFSVARRAKSIFESSEVDEKRAFLNYLIQNSTINEKTLAFTMRSPFNLILELADSSIGLPLVNKFRTVNWHLIESELYFNGISDLLKEGIV